MRTKDEHNKYKLGTHEVSLAGRCRYAYEPPAPRWVGGDTGAAAGELGVAWGGESALDGLRALAAMSMCFKGETGTLIDRTMEDWMLW